MRYKDVLDKYRKLSRDEWYNLLIDALKAEIPLPPGIGALSVLIEPLLASDERDQIISRGEPGKLLCYGALNPISGELVGEGFVEPSSYIDSGTGDFSIQFETALPGIDDYFILLRSEGANTKITDRTTFGFSFIVTDLDGPIPNIGVDKSVEFFVYKKGN